MEQSWFAMAVGAGLIFGFLIAWISLRSDRANIYARGRADAEKERGSLEERILAKDGRIQELQDHLRADREILEGLREENANLRATHVEYDSRVSEIRQQAEEKVALVNESQHRLVETLRGTLREKTEEQEARVAAIEGELELVRRENEHLRAAAEAAAVVQAPAADPVHGALLAEREMQLASVLAEALEMRKQIDGLLAEKAAWSAQPGSASAELLAERERQLTSVLGEALQLRERVEALEAEKTDREGQLAAALADSLVARDRVQALESEKAEPSPLEAELVEARARVQVLEAEKESTIPRELLAERDAQLALANEQVRKLVEEKAAAVPPELLAEREAQLAAANERVQALETELRAPGPDTELELAAVQAEALQLRERLQALEAESIPKEQAAEREAQLAVALSEAQAGRERAEQLQGEIHSLEIQKSELATAQADSLRRIESLEAEKSSRQQQSATDRVALSLLADRENQLKAAQQRIETLQSEHAAADAAREQQIEEIRQQASALEAQKAALTETAQERYAEIELLESELKDLADQLDKERLEHENLRAENARLEAAHVELQAALSVLRQARVRRAPFSPVRARRVVEMSGLAIHSEFSEAPDGSFADVVSIQLPGTKRIIIHSLPDIQPYRDAIDAATEVECTAKLAELAAGVRAHLGRVESGGKELAVAFLPGDVLLGVALEQDPDLLEFAAQRGVVVATPNSLVGLLGTAAASWRQHRLSAELTEVRAQNQGLFAQMAQLAGSVETLRSSLGAAMSTFERPEEETAPAATPSESEGELLASGVN